ncbi:fructoselysine 6-phosphate deglycase [Caproiciproducens galactitolivorans]|uniref:Fructoselysine 6-phosphate deglycase n=1 Tax=Caproiciproducens galactitolivorans TaxID=642589 RepID=A0ABT4BQ01_9FIRM|nr:fructoselysine 6-phosphate deglycase [Caproiciproducens galactitolivorans]MCY1712889.1 fructoselysine 6-phosphate deglycase [Caproiciproducens galactitolivorans]
MLNIDKNKVDFLVTTNMVKEVENLMEKDFPRLDKVVAKMVERKVDRVYFVACGSPLCACQTAQMLFEKYSDIPCKAYSGWDFLDQTPSKLDEHSMVIGISHYGKTEEVYNSIKRAREAGALTLGVTRDQEGTPLSKEAEYVLGYGAECIWEIHLLVSYYIACKYINAVKEHKEVSKILADLPKLPKILGELVVSQEEKSKELGIRASKWPFIYTVAAGPMLPLAYKEGVITMMEFTWTHGCMLNSAEFRHGPLEIVEKGVPYVFMLGTDESRHTTERTINFVKKFTENYIVFDYKDLNVDLHPMLAPMVLFVPLEFFYYYLSISKDHNPDDRRYYGGLVQY